MINKKRKNWDFFEKRVGKFCWCDLNHRLKKCFKGQLRAFLERTEYGTYNIDQRYVLT